MSRRIAGLVTAVVVVVALGFGAATPGVAASNELPSPPGLSNLIGCTAGHAPGSTSIGRCPAIAHSSTSAVHNSSSRRFTLALGVAWVPAVVILASAVAAPVAQLAHRTAGGLVAARAPPVFLR